MKTKPIITCIFTALSLSFCAQPAVSNTPIGDDTAAYCNGLADYAQSAAENRDSGSTEREALMRIIRTITDGPLRKDIITTARAVYHAEHLSPDDLHEIIRVSCWKTYAIEV